MRDESFVSGKELSEHLTAIIEPRLRLLFPAVPLAFSFIGPGSDVLGYDTPRSMDHDWGPRITIVVPPAMRDAVHTGIEEHIDELLPVTVAGLPTRFATHADGTVYPAPAGPIHRLTVTSIHQLLRDCLDIGTVDELRDAVWLTTPMQSLLEITSGSVFADDDGALSSLRAALDFYPDHILRYQLAALWMRVSQLQPFVGRNGEVGDDAGSAAITASLVRDLMRVGLLQSGRYAPYAKWLGSAFARVAVGAAALPDVSVALTAPDWQGREAGINRAGLQLIRQLNSLHLIPNIREEAIRFHTRPFHVLPAEEIAHALHDSLRETTLAFSPPFVGGIDMISDSTDAHKSQPLRQALRAMFPHVPGSVGFDEAL